MTSREFRQRLSKRSDQLGLALDPAVVERLERYIRLLAQWNQKMNLTAFALDDPGPHALDRLLIEPLAAARFVPSSSVDWVDVGSGGGSPAIPLKVLRPAAQLTMVESKSRKVAFLREVVRRLELSSTEVVQARLEEVAEQPSWRSRAGVVTIRAIRPDQALIKAALGILARGGQFLLFGTEAVGPSFDSRFVLTRATLPSSTLTIVRRAGTDDSATVEPGPASGHQCS